MSFWDLILISLLAVSANSQSVVDYIIYIVLVNKRK